MKSAFSRSVFLLAAFGAAACTTDAGGGGGGGYRGGGLTEVTRFHLGQPIARSTIAVESANPGLSNTPEFRTYAEAVGRQLTRLGWTVVTSVGQSEQVAIVDVRQGMREGPPRRPPVTIGIGGGTGGWRGGVGGGVGFGVGGGGPRAIASTSLEVRLKRRSDGSVIWEGRGHSDVPARSPYAQPAAAVERLANAMFGDFPGESGRTITIR
ncbi:MAG: DUF4136 domain-containing protein [Alphaproteobacteria bacterium]|nr:DUF4136 domain-containing protein [Alphaproteobacteria bacterium]